MTRTAILPLVVLGACVLLAGAGCNNESKSLKAHIALIEDTNQRLTDDLAASTRRIDDVIRESDALNDRLMVAHGESVDLRTQLVGMSAMSSSAAEATIVPSGWRAVRGGAMTAVGASLFSPGRATLKASGRSALGAIVGTLKGSLAQQDILIVGHTDDSPIKKSGWKDNYELSSQRALAVTRYLRDQGIDPQRLLACGSGEYRPRVPNDSDANRLKNRRIEIFAVNPW